MNRAKRHFWHIVFVFLIVILLGLVNLWQNRTSETNSMMTQMMGQSMGDMMVMMHASNISIADLFIWKEEMEEPMPSNMHDQGVYLRWLYDFTTTTVFFFTPFILSMTMLLLIVWNLS